MENQYKPEAQHWELVEAEGIMDNLIVNRSKVTDSIIKLLKDRDELGFKKFGVALEDSKRDRLVDLQEELVDALQYITSIIMLIQDFKDGPKTPQRKKAYVRSLAKKLLD